MTDAREILLRLPSQPEIAAALHALFGKEPHYETVRRMATALDCLRDGGWEFVETAPQIKQLEAEVARLKTSVKLLNGGFPCD